MGQVVDSIMAAARMGLGLSELLVKDVKPSIFARKPTVGGKLIEANHAAFNFGHLALYPSRLLTVCGLDGSSITAPAGFDDLFAAGKECRDDAEGTIYPEMNVVMDAFLRSHREAFESMAKVDDAVLSQPNPREGMRARLPTVGSAVVFYTNSHVMMHLGQVSTWRRCFGLGPVM